MGWLDAEFVVVCLAAMLSPTTLSFSILALVLGDRPLRTGLWFYLGAFSVTLVIGVVAAFLIGDAASPSDSTPPLWVCILDIVAAGIVLWFAVRFVRGAPDPARREQMMGQMSKVASSPAVAIVGAGATLANPGGFIPLAVKTISGEGPDSAGFIGLWLVFSVASLLPLAVAILALIVAPARAASILQHVQEWLMLHARAVASVIMFLLAAALLRNGIAGLVAQ